jgi:hypothetical protein
MRRYCFIKILAIVFLFVNCSVNNPEITINKEYFFGNWESNALLERIEFTATNAQWIFNLKKDTSLIFDSNLIDSLSYDSYDSNYLIMSYNGWELNTTKNTIDFLDTFTISPGKTAWGKSIIEYSIQSENSFYLLGIDSDPILFVRN